MEFPGIRIQLGGFTPEDLDATMKAVSHGTSFVIAGLLVSESYTPATISQRCPEQETRVISEPRMFEPLTSAWHFIPIHLFQSHVIVLYRPPRQRK